MTHLAAVGFLPRCCAFSAKPVASTKSYHIAVGGSKGQIKVRRGLIPFICFQLLPLPMQSGSSELHKACGCIHRHKPWLFTYRAQDKQIVHTHLMSRCWMKVATCAPSTAAKTAHRGCQTSCILQTTASWQPARTTPGSTSTSEHDQLIDALHGRLLGRLLDSAKPK